MTEQTEQNKQPMSARILRHIADLHEAGIIADDAKVAEEYQEWAESNNPVEAADYFIACISSDVSEPWRYGAADYFIAAIAKNERRLAWMRQHPDPTKTPLELWEEAKRAEKDGESEHE